MAPALINFALDNFIMKHRSFYAHIGFDQNTASGQIIILIRNIPLFCRFCIRPVSVCADRSLRGTPGASRILRASAGGDCGPRGSRNRQKTAEGPLMRISIRSYTSSSKILRLGIIKLTLASALDFRTLACAQDTLARQNASELAFALAYSYLWLRLRYFRLGNAQINLAFRSAYSYLCSRY